MPEQKFTVLNSGYSIGHADREHIKALNNIEQAAATIFPAGVLPEWVLTDTLSLDVLLAAQEKNMLWVVLETNKIPVGYLLLKIVDRLALLAQIDVHPCHGRKGLGTALISHAIRQLQEMSFSDLYLTTFSHVKWNAPFYEKLGFNILKKQEIPASINLILHEELAIGLHNRVAMKLSIKDVSANLSKTSF